MRLYKRIAPTHGGIRRNETTEGLPPERMWQELKENQSTGGLEGKTPIYPAEGIPFYTDIRSFTVNAMLPSGPAVIVLSASL